MRQLFKSIVVGALLTGAPSAFAGGMPESVNSSSANSASSSTTAAQTLSKSSTSANATTSSSLAGSTSSQSSGSGLLQLRMILIVDASAIMDDDGMGMFKSNGKFLLMDVLG